MNLSRQEAVESQVEELKLEQKDFLLKEAFEEFRLAERNDSAWIIRELNSIHRKVDVLLEKE